MWGLYRPIPSQLRVDPQSRVSLTTHVDVALLPPAAGVARFSTIVIRPAVFVEQGIHPHMINALNKMNWTLLAQGEPEQNGAQPGVFDMLSGMMLPIGMIIVLYIVLMVLPQRKEQKKVQEFLNSLKKNDQVILQGGILATILNVQKDQEIVTVRIDETTNAKMKVLRSSIVKVVKEKDEIESGAEKG